MRLPQLTALQVGEHTELRIVPEACRFCYMPVSLGVWRGMRDTSWRVTFHTRLWIVWGFCFEIESRVARAGFKLTSLAEALSS